MKFKLIIFFIVCLTSIRSSYAWVAEGHARATRCALELDSGKLPEFFTGGANAIAHCSADPDVFKISVESQQLRLTESPEHYIDLELLEGKELPTTREAFAQLCAAHNRSIYKVGTVPYAVAEWNQRLTLAFAEYRKWPKNEIVRTKCLIYAGNLAHYAEDMCMPLHTTVHHDGMVHDFNTPSPKTGIHLKVDALLHKVMDYNTTTTGAGNIEPFPELWSAIKVQLNESNRLVPKVYELEDQLPDLNSPLTTGSKVSVFAKQELEATSVFTARIFLTAWMDSAAVKLPAWHYRDPTEIVSAQGERVEKPNGK